MCGPLEKPGTFRRQDIEPPVESWAELPHGDHVGRARGPGCWGAHLGVLELLVPLDRTRSATVVALVESELAELHRDLLSELMGCYPRIRAEILAIAQQCQPAEPPALDRLFETPEPIGEPVRD